MQTKGQTKKSALYALWYNDQLLTKKNGRIQIENALDKTTIKKKVGQVSVCLIVHYLSCSGRL